jgi:hypothetical protein
MGRVDDGVPRARVLNMSVIPEGFDNRPEEPATDAPTKKDPPTPNGRGELAPAAGVNEGSPQIAPTGDQPRRRRRRRRRHRRARIDGTAADSATAPAENPSEVREASAQPLATGASSSATTEHPGATQPPTTNAPRKRRRRQRRRRREGDGAAAATGDLAPGRLGKPIRVGVAAEPGETQRHGGPRHRPRRQRESREEPPRNRDNRREQVRDPRTGEDRESSGRDARAPRHKHGAGRPKDRSRGRNCDNVRKKPEVKLYRLEAVVDRGFEDIADPATEGATRRVDWTILKRTTADQRTARTLSAVYVLRRDGIDTEFAQLSAARAAVHKTISHPEKLTLSKADHAAARGAKK